MVEFRCDLDEPGVGVDRDEPSVEEGMQVAAEQQAAARVVGGVGAVQVQMGGFEGSGWLGAGEGARFAVAGQHFFAEALLADPGLGERQGVTAGDAFVAMLRGLPPGGAGDQVRVEDGLKVRQVQTAHGVLLCVAYVGGGEFSRGERAVSWTPGTRIVGREHLDGEFFLGRDVELRDAPRAPIRELLSRAVLEVGARAVRAAVPDLPARCSLDAVDPPGAEDHAVVADDRKVSRQEVPAVRNGGVPYIAHAKLVGIRELAVRSRREAQQAPGAKRPDPRRRHELSVQPYDPSIRHVETDSRVNMLGSLCLIYNR